MKIKKEDCKITLTAEPEFIHPEDCFAYPEMQEDIDRILEDVEWNKWAWFCAKVTVEWHGLKATDYLGACSYRSHDDFVDSVYYDDMVAKCIKDLEQQFNDLMFQANVFQVGDHVVVTLIDNGNDFMGELTCIEKITETLTVYTVTARKKSELNAEIYVSRKGINPRQIGS